MQKDVIYIDVEDDITAIIGKVKASKNKIVALVPPKRTGVIQSAVNLKLVHRATEQAGKHLVIISNNAALIALAGSAGVPVAKNLQSKPEMAEIPALEVDDGEDIIDGSAISVGEHSEHAAGSVDDSLAPSVGAAALSAAGSDENSSRMTPLVNAVSNVKSRAKVPDFDGFRKKLFLGLGAGILLVSFLVWAIVFAPAARIIITARTSDVAINSKVTLGSTLTSDLKAGTVKSIAKTSKKDISIPLVATGKKEVGEKATGTVKFTTNSISALGTTIAAGTALTSSNGSEFVTSTSVTMTLSNASTGATTAVVASERGTKHNAATGVVSGAPAGINASLTGPTGGGTDKSITVVQQSDVDLVSGEVTKQVNVDEAKKQLLAQFGNDFVVIESSFKSDTSQVKPSPAVDAESVDGKGVLSGSVSFSLTAIAKVEIAKYLDAYFAQQVDGKNDQRVYDNGLKSVTLTSVIASESNYIATISTNGKIGPKIDEAKLKEFARGKKFGEIQSYIEATNGIDQADIKFSPFWVNHAPDDIKRITVEFKVNGV